MPDILDVIDDGVNEISTLNDLTISSNLIVWVTLAVIFIIFIIWILMVYSNDSLDLLKDLASVANQVELVSDQITN